MIRESDWLTVLSLSDFSSYFTSNEFAELSMVCKKFRVKLNATIFKNFNFKSFVTTMDYQNYTEKEDIFTSIKVDQEGENYYLGDQYKTLNSKLIESKERFQSDLKLLSIQPIQLILSGRGKYYLLENIEGVFANLNCLIFSKSLINFYTFQHLIDNIPCLENLNLSNTYLYATSDSNPTQVNWPNSLKKLKIHNSRKALHSIGNNPVLTVSDVSGSFGSSKLDFSPKNLPNLEVFHYISSCITNALEIVDFLMLNPQIKNLKISENSFGAKLLAVIRNIDSLNHLHLDFRFYNEVKSELKYIVLLENTRYLTIGLERFDINNASLINMFSNLSKLIIKSTNEKFDYYKSLIGKFSAIKDIVLKIEVRSIGVKKFKFPESSNLIEVEFIFSSYKSFETVKWDSNGCPNLKLVKFVKNEDDREPFDRSKLNRELENGWRLSYLPYKIFYNKINQ